MATNNNRLTAEQIRELIAILRKQEEARQQPSQQDGGDSGINWDLIDYYLQNGDFSRIFGDGGTSAAGAVNTPSVISTPTGITATRVPSTTVSTPTGVSAARIPSTSGASASVSSTPVPTSAPAPAATGAGAGALQGISGSAPSVASTSVATPTGIAATRVPSTTVATPTGITATRVPSTTTPTGASTGPRLQGNNAAYIAMIMDAYNAYKGATNDKLDKKGQAVEAGKNIGMGVADYFTGGLASLGRALALRTGIGRKAERFVDNKLIRNDPLNKFWAYSGILGGLSTEAKQQKRAKDLIDKNVTGYKDYYSQSKGSLDEYKKQYGKKITNTAGARSDLDSNFIGYDPESGRWINNAYANTGDLSTLRPEDAWGSEGVFKVFGNDWLGKYTGDERRKITQALLDAQAFRSDSGDLVIDDKEKARQIGAQALGEVSKPQTETWGTVPETGIENVLSPEQAAQLQSVIDSAKENGAVLKGAGLVENNPHIPEWKESNAWRTSVNRIPDTGRYPSGLPVGGPAQRLNPSALSDPRSVPGYNQMSSAQKEQLWKSHREAVQAPKPMMPSESGLTPDRLALLKRMFSN